jgi:hypothetical protein
VYVFCLGCEQIDSLWPEYGHHLERFEREGHEFAELIKRDLKSEQKQLWGLQDTSGNVAGVVVTKIAVTPKGKRCDVCAACGTSEGLKQVSELILPAIEEWAKAIGCIAVRVEGRMGWKRVLDYPQVGVILEKEL